MNDRETELREIRSALLSQAGSMYDPDDAQKFLMELDIYKHIGARFLCWMIKLRLIPPARSQWGSKLYNLHDSYRNSLIRFYPNDTQTPLSLLPYPIATHIEQDISRTIKWFRKCAEQIELAARVIEDAELRVKRILSIISLESPELSYIQGNDRICLMCYLVSLYFSTRGSLNKDFAEAMCYHLSKTIITKITLSRKLDSAGYLDDHFESLDVLIEQEDPEKASILSQAGHSSAHFALRWELTLFSDSHDIYSLMLLWDYILVKFYDFDEFIRCACVAHVMQVPVPSNPSDLTEVIQHYSKWDMMKIINDAMSLMETDDEMSCMQSLWLAIKTFFRRS